MLLSDVQIRKAIEDGELTIEPFGEECLQGASYDLRIGPEALMSGQEKVSNLEHEGTLTIKPGQFAIINTLEKVKTSEKIAGRIGVRSYFTRKGLVFLTGLQIDPGFDGVLILGLYNASPRNMVLEYAEPFCSVEFHRLQIPAATEYDTDPAQKAGHLPRIDKEYLRSLETETLSDIAEGMRTLTQNLGVMSKMMYYVLIPLIVGLYIALFSFFIAGS